MGLIRDLPSVPGKTPVILLTTFSGPNPLDSYGNYGNDNTYKSYSNSCGSSSRSPQHLRAHHQGYQQNEEPSSSFSAGSPLFEPMVMHQQDEKDVVGPATTQKEGKRKKKKKKKTASSSSASSLDPAPKPTESAAPPPSETLPSIHEQENEKYIMNKEFPTLLESFGVVQGQGDAVTTSKSKNKKSKAKKTVAAVTVAGVEEAIRSSFEQVGSKAPDVQLEDEHKDMAMMALVHEPVTVSGNMNYHGSFSDLGHRQALYATVACRNDCLSFLNDDFVCTGLSSWADDIDEYEQRQHPPISSSTAFPSGPLTKASPVTLSPKQIAQGDVPKTLAYKDSVATQGAPTQPQDARFLTAPHPESCHSYWESAPRLYKARPEEALRDSGNYFDYEQPQPPREYLGRSNEHFWRCFGEYPAPPYDYHQRFPTRCHPGYTHCSPMHEPPTHSHQNPMPGDYPLYKYQTRNSTQPRVQATQSHFERAMGLTHPRATGQHQQQNTQQITKQPLQQSTKQPTKQHQKQHPKQHPKRSTKRSEHRFAQQHIHQPPKQPTRKRTEQHHQHHQHQLPVVGSSFALDPTPAQAFPKQPKTETTSHSRTKIGADNPWMSFIKPAWMTRSRSREDQGYAGPSVHPEALEKCKSASNPSTDTANTDTVISQQVWGTPKGKRAATKPGLDNVIHQSQKNRSKKQKEQRQLPLPARSQDRSYDQPQWSPLTQGQQRPKDETHDRLFSHTEQQEIFYTEEGSQWSSKAGGLPWNLKVNGKSNRSANKPWEDRNKVIEFFSKRWVEARMSSGGQDPDAAVVYCSSS
ncbi:hypothetical protein EC991_010734 [Linnemannia zychae]|nr:hypothetical protein EC991_010734 [Linnemannia zychae]